MFPLKSRKLIRGVEGHVKAGLSPAADYVASYTELYAPFDGVVEAYWGPEGGNWLRLTRPNGDAIEHAHLSRYAIKSGMVREGQLVAITGNTGAITTNPHLHIQILRNGKRLDPEAYNWITMESITFNIKVVANNQNWNYREYLDKAANWYRDKSSNRINLAYTVEDTQFSNIPFNDGHVDKHWYTENVLSKSKGFDISILLLDIWNGTTGSWGWMTGDSEQKTMTTECFYRDWIGEYNMWMVAHEISHVIFYLTVGTPRDLTHTYFSGDVAQNNQNSHKIFDFVEFETLLSTLNRRRKEQGMLEIVNENGTYFLVGEKAKMGLNGIESLNFFRKLTDKERAGSTSGIPQLGVFESQLGIDLD